jgi:hypothetical protein
MVSPLTLVLFLAGERKENDNLLLERLAAIGEDECLAGGSVRSLIRKKVGRERKPTIYKYHPSFPRLHRASMGLWEAVKSVAMIEDSRVPRTRKSGSSLGPNLSPCALSSVYALRAARGVIHSSLGPSSRQKQRKQVNRHRHVYIVRMYLVASRSRAAYGKCHCPT